jgi:Spy/CpxP family protein refolding chaperone
MKSIRSLFTTAAAVALFALTAPVPSLSAMKEMPGKDHHESHGGMMEKGHMDTMGDMMGMCMEHAEKLGLSDDQVAKMKPLHSDMQKRQARYKADLKIAEIELQDILDVKDFDLDKASSSAKKISEIRTAHHLEMLKSMKEMRTTLTDDQFKKMKMMMMTMHRGENRPAKKAMKK